VLRFLCPDDLPFDSGVAVSQNLERCALDPYSGFSRQHDFIPAPFLSEPVGGVPSFFD
jgi:hypothetical protein